jgi:3-phosphoshikimate 1-carboxyvinyltransferase
MSSDDSLYEVKTSSFIRNIEVPRSKSYANRLLILAAVKPGAVTITNLPESNDVTMLVECFENIGLIIEKNEKDITIHNSFPACEKKKEIIKLETGDGGTTNRFLLALLSLGKRKYQLIPEGHMRNRPMGPLLEALEALNVSVSKGEDDYWIEIQGPLSGKGVAVNSSVSTQFVTAIALALAETDIDVQPIKLENSELYWKLTENLIQAYKKKEILWDVPLDFSGLSYPLALGLVDGSVEISNYRKRDLLQADSIFLEIIEKMGGLLELAEKSGLSLKSPQKLDPIDYDCSGFPDLVPTLAFVCSYADGSSYLRNLGVLRHKESDRVEEILKLLRQFKISFEYDNLTEDLCIHGNGPKVGREETFPAADHRMVMTSYLFLRKNSGGSLSNYKHVKKSFPDFFKEMED